MIEVATQAGGDAKADVANIDRHSDGGADIIERVPSVEVVPSEQFDLTLKQQSAQRLELKAEAWVDVAAPLADAHGGTEFQPPRGQRSDDQFGIVIALKGVPVEAGPV